MSGIPFMVIMEVSRLLPYWEKPAIWDQAIDNNMQLKHTWQPASRVSAYVQ